MKYALSQTLGLVSFVLVTFATAPAGAQTTANGPYYATPSWDLQLPASTRFIVLANWNSEAVLDRETGLVWERAPEVSPITWDTARFRCLNKAVGGRKGWRLPSINELASLVDPTIAGSDLPTGHPFTDIQLNTYWSATTAVRTDFAWIVFFDGSGSLGTGDKSNEFFYWCVRGGGVLDNY